MLLLLMSILLIQWFGVYVDVVDVVGYVVIVDIVVDVVAVDVADVDVVVDSADADVELLLILGYRCCCWCC